MTKTDCYYYDTCDRSCGDCEYYDSVFGNEIDIEERRTEFMTEFFEYINEIEPEFD